MTWATCSILSRDAESCLRNSMTQSRGNVQFASSYSRKQPILKKRKLNSRNDLRKWRNYCLISNKNALLKTASSNFKSIFLTLLIVSKKKRSMMISSQIDKIWFASIIAITASIYFVCTDIGSCPAPLRSALMATQLIMSFPRSSVVPFVEERRPKRRFNMLTNFTKSTQRSRIKAIWTSSEKSAPLRHLMSLDIKLSTIVR